ncbi:MAG: aminoacyl-tRNA hydrolase [Candidatus Kerfeldbacteria bacterium]|nr:aminoacyl-tRNA hydrolase [Candidatus Kerfeldbacteria bacterium]
MTTLIVGLGNPGRRFHETRHNLGFLAVDALAGVLGADWRKAGNGTLLLAEARRGHHRVLLAKPQTFMNRSGPPVASLVRAKRLPLLRLWVVVDDLDLPFGRLRLRERGSSGGHHGLDSLVTALGSNAFPRLRIGIGPAHKPGRFDGAAYVLQRLSANGRNLLPAIIQSAADALLRGLDDGFPAAMNAFNVKGERQPRDS